MNKLKVLDLFSGIGGFSLGLESTGFFETIAFVEKDKFCRQVLQKNFNNIPIEEDIRNVRGSNYQADVITGGFPCQPFSVAGKRKGTDDDRYLWDETIRVVAESKCRWFIGENVEGLININNGMVLRQVQTDLEEQGFQVQCLVIPASGIGAWHQRKRVWIIANSNNARNRTSQHEINKDRKKIDEGRKEQSQFKSSRHIKNVSNSDISSKTKRREYENDEKTSSSREYFKRRSVSNGGERCVQSTWENKDVPNSDSRLCGGRGTEFQSRDDGQWGFYSKEEEQARNDIRSKTFGCDAILGEKENVWNSESTGLQSSFDRQRKREFWRTSTPREQCQRTWWQIESELCGVPNGVSYELDKNRSNRIKSLGNSIVPQIAREIGLAIAIAETE